MQIWIDAQLSPAIAGWIVDTFHTNFNIALPRAIALLEAGEKIIEIRGA